MKSPPKGEEKRGGNQKSKGKKEEAEPINSSVPDKAVASTGVVPESIARKVWLMTVQGFPSI